MKARFFALILFLGLSLSSNVFAANHPGALTLGAGVGYDYLSSKRHAKNSGLVFGTVGYNLTDRWAVQGLLAGFNTNFKSSVDDPRKIDVTIFSFNGVYRFHPVPLIEPYVLAGVGIIGMSHSQTDANNEANINGGLGLQFFVDDFLAFNVEARDFYTMIGGKNDVVLLAGFNVLFDLCRFKD